MTSTIDIRVRFALASCLVLASCGDDGSAPAAASSDGSGTTSSVDTTTTGGDVSSCVVESREPVRRLSAFEYTRALRELLGVEIEESTLPPSSVTTVFATEDAALGSSPVLVEGQFDATAIAAASVLARLEAGEAEAFMGCATIDAACVDTWLGVFGKQVYRRPLAADERTRLATLYAEVAAVDGTNVAVAATVQALLLSPRFGFHVEEQTEDGAPDDYAIASRLAFFLWSSTPDDALLDAADRGALADPLERAAQAERLLADPRAAQSIVRMWRELLDLDELATQTPFDDRWTPGLQGEMNAELDRFVAATIFEREGTLAALLTSRFVDAGPELGALYGIIGDELPPERAGLVTRAAFLTRTSKGDSPSPVLRGLAVLDRLACTAVAPPPTTVADVPDAGAGVTNRDRYEQHTSDPACATCHQQFDPIGFALEHFDAIGGYRDVDNGASIDATALVLGTAIDGAAELSAVLAAHEIVATCAVTQSLRLHLGHTLREGEACARDEIAERFIAGGGDIQALLVDIVASPLFVQ